MDNKDNIIIEGAKLMWRNFEGREGQFNRAGDRNFCIFLEPELADELTAKGWNIKAAKNAEDPDDAQPYIQVAVGYKGRPPKIVLITSQGRTDLEEEDVDMLDWAEIENVDLILRPYDWAMSGKTGRKAYLKSMFFTMAEDRLTLKYANVPEVGAPPQRLAIGDGSDPEVWEAEVVD